MNCREDGLPLWYKVRLAEKYLSQKTGINFDGIFSPIMKMSSIRLILDLAVDIKEEIEQLDVKTVLLHGDL